MIAKYDPNRKQIGILAILEMQTLAGSACETSNELRDSRDRQACLRDTPSHTDQTSQSACFSHYNTHSTLE